MSINCSSQLYSLLNSLNYLSETVCMHVCMVFFYLSGFVRSPSQVGGNISYCWCKIYTLISHIFGVFFIYNEFHGDLAIQRC